MVATGEVEDILKSSTGDIFLDALFDCDYVLRNIPRRCINASSFSSMVMPQPKFFDDVKTDYGIDLSDQVAQVETYVHLLSLNVFSNAQDDSIMTWSDSPYAVAQKLAEDVVQTSRGLIKRDLAFRSAGIAARILEILPNNWGNEVICRLSSLKYIVEEEYVRITSQDSTTVYTQGLLRIINKEKCIVSLSTHRDVREGDCVLVSLRAGAGVSGLTEIFLDDRVYNQKRTELLTPKTIRVDGGHNFDEVLSRVHFDGFTGDKVVACMSSSVFKKLRFDFPGIQAVDNGLEVYYEYKDTVIVINDYIPEKLNMDDLILVLDLSTIELYCQEPPKFIRTPEGNIITILDDPVNVKKNLSLSIKFDYQLCCNDFKKNFIVRLA